MARGYSFHWVVTALAQNLLIRPLILRHDILIEILIFNLNVYRYIYMLLFDNVLSDIDLIIFFFFLFFSYAINYGFIILVLQWVKYTFYRLEDIDSRPDSFRCVPARNSSKTSIKLFIETF